jgi:hypothetical protein
MKKLSSNSRYQKTREHNILKQFREACDNFPDGKIHASEAPDFIIKYGKKSAIGIELTSILEPVDNENGMGTALETPELVPEVIEKCIRQKEEKLAGYLRKKLNGIWLIIEVRNLNQNTSFNISNKLELWEFNSAFERVFLFETTGNRIFKLV